MNTKKKTIAIALILTASLALAGCGSPKAEPKGSGESSTVEAQNDTEKTNSPESKDEPSTDSAKEDISSETGEANYEPVTIDCSEIISSGNTSYFELMLQYGDACAVSVRYLYENGMYAGVSIKVAPGTETDLEAIINNTSVLESSNPSYFTETADGWTMDYETEGEEGGYMDSYSIEDIRVLTWGMALMAEGYSQEEAEAIVGVISEPEPSFGTDDPSDFGQGEITIEDVSYTLLSLDESTILFTAYYADAFTIEEEFRFDANGDFEGLETTLIVGRVSDTDEIFEMLESLYGTAFDPDDYTLSEQSAIDYIMCDSIPTRSFFLGSDLAGMSGVTYSAIYEVLSEAI